MIINNYYQIVKSNLNEFIFFLPKKKMLNCIVDANICNLFPNYFYTLKCFIEFLPIMHRKSVN